MKKYILSFILGLLVSTTAFAGSFVEQADSAYNKEDYRKAIELYTQSIAQHGVSADIYYNLGNAYYRNENLGKAVINYERALRLNPRHEDASTNLEFVKNHIQDRPEDDSSFLSNLHHSIISLMSPNVRAWIAFMIFIILLSAVALYIFSRNVTLRKTGFFGGIVFFFIFIYSAVLAGDSVDKATSNSEAVVIVPTTHLSSTPRVSRNSTDKVVAIHEGTKVEIIDSVATPDDPVSPKWYDVKINNSTRAWLRASDVERI